MRVAIETDVADKPELLAIAQAADDYGLSLYPAESYYALDVNEFSAPGVEVFVCRADDAGDASAVGMAALLDRGDGSAELKRMFVLESARGRGVAGGILKAIEAHAGMMGITLIQLETGPLQPAAIALYEKHGYRHIANFGPYVGDPLSVCMEKSL